MAVRLVSIRDKDDTVSGADRQNMLLYFEEARKNYKSKRKINEGLGARDGRF
jgi:hypothetical protein